MAKQGRVKKVIKVIGKGGKALKRSYIAVKRGYGVFMKAASPAVQRYGAQTRHIFATPEQENAFTRRRRLLRRYY